MDSAAIRPEFRWQIRGRTERCREARTVAGTCSRGSTATGCTCPSASTAIPPRISIGSSTSGWRPGSRSIVRWTAKTPCRRACATCSAVSPPPRGFWTGFRRCRHATSDCARRSSRSGGMPCRRSATMCSIRPISSRRPYASRWARGRRPGMRGWRPLWRKRAAGPARSRRRGGAGSRSRFFPCSSGVASARNAPACACAG